MASKVPQKESKTSQLRALAEKRKLEKEQQKKKAEPKPNEIPVKSTHYQLERIRFTYFAACANYPKEGETNALPVWWSNNEFGMQLWKEIDQSNNPYAELGPLNDGWIPFDYLMELLNDILGLLPRTFTDVYINWHYKWQIGYAQYVNGRYEKYVNPKTGKESSVYKADLLTELVEEKTRSQGNPPTTGFTEEEREEYNKLKRERDDNEA